MPVLTFALTMVVASALLSFATWRLAAADEHTPSDQVLPALALIVATGLAARLLLVASEPILEVDFHRYLWEGGLVANGYSPYAIAPRRVLDLPYDDIRLELAKAAGPVFERISYPELTTVYPPVAQVWFALAHRIEPWSLGAWRLLVIAADCVTLALIVALLREAGRSPLWCVLYWWSPLVLKEIANSAHMEAVLLPAVLASLFLAARRRHAAALGLLVLAIGTKLWPILLAPLLLRPLVCRPAAFAAGIVLVAAGAALTVLPAWIGGLDASSGFVGFASQWATNSAHFPILERAVAMLTGLDGGSGWPGRIARAVCALLAAGLALAAAWRPIADGADLMRRASFVAGAVVLLSPAQFPWYVLWVLPLAVVRGGIGWHAAAALLPAYYTAFHFIAAGTYATFETTVVWLIWCPVWGALAFDLSRARRGAPH